jgi:predicted ATPase
MLTEIKLTNFKCFKEETCIPLSRFNLFTGVNGAGKSTALQALLLMRQSIEHNPYTTELILNGSCVNLGGINDVRNYEVSKEEAVIFEINSNNNFDKNIRYYLSPTFDEMNLSISEIDLTLIYKGEKSRHHFNKSKKKPFIFSVVRNDLCKYPNSEVELYHLFPSDFTWTIKRLQKEMSILNIVSNINLTHFISADRIGPQEFYSKSNISEFVNVGIKGEFTINLLDKIPQALVNESLCLGNDARTLLTQTEAWMSKALDTDIKLKITPLRVNILELMINDFKPSNVGFGYSSFLPIIVTGLIAKPGEKIIIENPEIHLHPKAQSALIEFLIKVANTGVQVFIESHSDHVLNALRIVTKNKLIKPEDANILFFGLENGNSKIIKPTLDENGRIDQWPEYFFDETAKSLASLAAGQRPRIKAPKAEV